MVECNGSVANVNGTFRHKSCKRVSITGTSFHDLTCNCSQIPQEKDFRMRVMREERALEKRGCDIGAGRRLGYLSVFELAKHTVVER